MGGRPFGARAQTGFPSAGQARQAAPPPLFPPGMTPPSNQPAPSNLPNPFGQPQNTPPRQYPSYTPGQSAGGYISNQMGADPGQSLDFTTKLREQKEALEAQLQAQRDLVNQYRGDYEQQQQRMGDLEISYPPDPRIQEARNFLSQQRPVNGRTPNPYYGMTPQQYIKDMEDAMRNQPGAP